jgi:hypothetical protein
VAALWLLWWKLSQQGDGDQADAIMERIERRDIDPSHLFCLWWGATRAGEPELAARILELIAYRAMVEELEAATVQRQNPPSLSETAL